MYGIIPIKKAYRIIEKQNPELELTKETFSEIVSNIDFSRKHYVIWSEDEVYDENVEDCPVLDKLLIAEYAIMFGDSKDYEALVLEQDDRPFYVPEKNELLKYEDQFYYEKTKHNLNLENFLRDEFGIPNYEEIVDELALLLTIDENDPDEAITTVKRMGSPKFKEFANRMQAQKFAQLYLYTNHHKNKYAKTGSKI